MSIFDQNYDFFNHNFDFSYILFVTKFGFLEKILDKNFDFGQKFLLWTKNFILDKNLVFCTKI